MNRCLYRLACRLRSAPGRVPRRARAAGRAGDGLLYLAWGRLGDAILAGPFTERLRALGRGPVVAVARREAAAVLAPQADRFVPLDEADPAAVGGPFAAVVTDLHVFHGGLPALGPLLAGVEAVHRLAYGGYVARHRLAPRRPFPAGVTVVPGLAKPDTGSDPERVHLWNDLEHYHGALARALGGPPLPDEGLRPLLRLDPRAVAAALARFGLEPGAYWACQPATSIAKKDYPLSAWTRVLAAFPQRRFALLGTAREGARTRALRAANALDLAGRTDAGEALALVADAAGFVGPDSAFAHAAVALGVPTVCIAQNANLGFFFPYPRRLGTDHLRVVHHPDFERCAGCFSVCAHEPLWTTYRRGALCLRTLPPDLVVRALRDPPARRLAVPAQPVDGAALSAR